VCQGQGSILPRQPCLSEAESLPETGHDR
jgi:hypothetical protein